MIRDPVGVRVLVRVLAAGVSFTDARLRAGTYLPGAPKPPFTSGHELVGIVEELGTGCSRLRIGDRIGARQHGRNPRPRRMDPQIAATAARHGLILLTRNGSVHRPAVRARNSRPAGPHTRDDRPGAPD